MEGIPHVYRYCSLCSQQPMHRNRKKAISRNPVSGLSRKIGVTTPRGDSGCTVTVYLTNIKDHVMNT